MVNLILRKKKKKTQLFIYECIGNLTSMHTIQLEMLFSYTFAVCMCNILLFKFHYNRSTRTVYGKIMAVHWLNAIECKISNAMYIKNEF